MAYDSKPSKDYCEQIGLAFSQEDFDQFAPLAKEQNLTQEHVDFVMQQHAWRVKCLFNPKSYNYFNRVKVALYFLNPFVRGIE